ncbi:MAG: hypothetical protein OIF50_11180 [Flavobacteriaceae bacterium]|nr:hypothetical protein [Flavobacteriaceae bacterium]
MEKNQTEAPQIKNDNLTTTQEATKKRNQKSTRIENRVETARQLQTYLKDMPLLKKKDEASIIAFDQEYLTTRDLMAKMKTVKVDKTFKVRERKEAFNHKQLGLMKRCTIIAQYFEGKIGIDQKHLDILKDIIRQMRNSRKKQRVEEAAVNSSTNKIVLRVSNHTSTYGHRLEGLYYILQIIDRVGEVYDPAKELIQTKKLKQLYAKLEKLNQEVANQTLVYTRARKKSTKAAKQLMGSARKVRKLIYATYEEDSAECILVQQLNLV